MKTLGVWEMSKEVEGALGGCVIALGGVSTDEKAEEVEVLAEAERRDGFALLGRQLTNTTCCSAALQLGTTFGTMRSPLQARGASCNASGASRVSGT